MNNNPNEKLASFIIASEEKISDDGINEVKHYFEHGEYEMSFEGLVIELMSVRKYPDNFDFNDWKELAIYYGLDRESVFEGDFWMEFLQWGGRTLKKLENRIRINFKTLIDYMPFKVLLMKKTIY